MMSDKLLRYTDFGMAKMLLTHFVRNIMWKVVVIVAKDGERQACGVLIFL